MTIDNLPRPWVLAALTGLKVSELLALPEDDRSRWRREDTLPRPQARRRRLRAVSAELQAPSLN